MFNDDPYSRQRQRNQGAVGGAPAAPAQVTRIAQPPPGLPPNASRTTLPPSSIIKPPTRYARPTLSEPPAVAAPKPATGLLGAGVGDMADAMRSQPPGSGVLNRIGTAIQGAAPNSTAAFSAAATPQSGEGVFGMLGRGTRMVKEAVVTPFEATGNAATAVGGAVGNAKNALAAGYNLQQPPAPQATITTSPATNQRPVFSIGPKQIASGVNALAGALTRAPNVAGAPAAAPASAAPSTLIGFTGDGMSGRANAAAPGQVALSQGRPAQIQEGYAQINSGFYRDPNGAVIQGQAPTTGAAVAGRPLPGAPLVGADGSVQYDQAWADKNKSLIAGYAEKNVMPMGVPGPGVAASMVTGGNMPSGPLTRPPRGFTNEDRAAQLDGLERQGRDYAVRSLREKAKTASFYGDATRSDALLAQAQQAGIAAPPRVAQMTRPNPNDDARLDMERQRLGMDQNQAGLQAEQTQIVTQQQQLRLKQAQQMQALSEQLMQGTPEQKQEAAKYFAATQQLKPGQPIKLKQSYDTGRVDFDKNPIMADYEILMSQDGKVLYDPMAQGGQQKRPVGQMQEEKTGKIYDVYADGTRQEVQQ